MKYTIPELIKRLESKKRIKFLFFWGHQPAKNGEITASCLSQWWVGSFESDGKVYKTAEHWMMVKKAELFNDPITKQIHQANTAAEAKALGRKVKDFSPEIWNQHKYEIVRQGTWLKFSQNPELTSFLLNTKNRVLVEASPVDKIWGIGLPKDHPRAESPANWRGQNLLGFALMEVRDALRDAS